MSEQGYNGWTNYPTWAVNLWLSNDEPLYREALRLTAETADDASETIQVQAEIWTVEQATRFTVADALKTWVTDDLAPDLDASFASDLLGYALGQVDWEEIADAWIEMAVSA